MHTPKPHRAADERNQLIWFVFGRERSLLSRPSGAFLFSPPSLLSTKHPCPSLPLGQSLPHALVGHCGVVVLGHDDWQLLSLALAERLLPSVALLGITMGVGALRRGMLEEMPAGGRLHSELPVMPAAPEIEHTLPPRGFTPSISHCELLQKTISSLGLFLRKVGTDTTQVTTQCFLSLSVKGECHSFILNPCFTLEPLGFSTKDRLPHSPARLPSHYCIN